MKCLVSTCCLLITLFGTILSQSKSWSPQDRSEFLRAFAHAKGIGANAENHGEVIGKCGLRFAWEAAFYGEAFPASEMIRLRELLSPFQLQTSRLIGLFRIHYDTTGVNTPAILSCDSARIPNSYEAYVDSVGRIFNDVHNFEIDSLGYESPFQSGQSEYDVYIANINMYGFTESLQRIGSTNPPRYRSAITIDNDYFRFFSPGMAGLKVTVAHEFHHAIQLASYGAWMSDYYFLEITSTWMEDVVYDDVNDYYQYLKSPSSSPRGQFSSPDIGFTQSDGLIEYSRAIWGKFIEERFSRNLMRRAWEFIRQAPALGAMDLALTEVGRSFRDAFLEWSSWNLRTALRSDTLQYYREGNHYPTMRERTVFEYTSPERSFSDSIQAVSSVYQPISLSGTQMMVIVSNLNFATSGASDFPFLYEVRDQGDLSYKHLANGLSVKLNVPDPGNWATQETAPSIVTEVIAFPNPFFPRESKPLRFRLPITPRSPVATLAIFSSSLDAVFSGELEITEELIRPSEPVLLWNGKTQTLRHVPSGVYFYVITADNQQFKGKFTVIRE